MNKTTPPPIMVEMKYEKMNRKKVLAHGEYHGYAFMILNICGMHPCAYVENRIGAEDYDDTKLDEVNVHGGFTYLGVLDEDERGIEYLGWDYAHWGDYTNSFFDLGGGLGGKKWETKEIYGEVKNVIRQLERLEE